MISQYIGKKNLIKLTREQTQAFLTRKWTKHKYKILFDDEFELGVC